MGDEWRRAPGSSGMPLPAPKRIDSLAFQRIDNATFCGRQLVSALASSSNSSVVGTSAISFFRRKVARPSTGLVGMTVAASPCQYARMPLVP